MSNCEFTKWSVSQITQAVKGDSKEMLIKVPCFQRGIVWGETKRIELIKSLRSEFPVGALLVYKKGTSSEYLLIDGLQRTNTLRDQDKNPCKYIDPLLIKDLAQDITKHFPSKDYTEEDVVTILKDWLGRFTGKTLDEKNGFSTHELADILETKLKIDEKLNKSLCRTISPHYTKILTASDISKIQLPVIIYSGDESSLPDIFDRLNNQGTKLNKFEIFAALWEKHKCRIGNKEICKLVQGKYEKLIDQGFEIDGYDPKDFKKKEFTYFEYIFGIGKYLTKQFPLLFAASKGDESPDSEGFNICAASLLKDLARIKSLPEEIQKHIGNQPEFEAAIYDSVDFIQSLIKPIITIHANKSKNSSNKNPTIYHTEYQIVTMVATAFTHRFDELLKERPNWKSEKKILEKTIPQYLLLEILNSEWRGSGDNRLRAALKENTYLNEITRKSWELSLHNWFEQQNSKKQNARTHIESETVLFLKYIYAYLLSAHTAHDATQEFEIEHLVPIERLMGQSTDGLAISSISNLCLIPKLINRTKGNLTIYEYFDNQIKEGKITQEKAEAEIAKLEKYTLTTRSDLNFVTSNLTSTTYAKFLQDRTNILTNIFLKNLGI